MDVFANARAGFETAIVQADGALAVPTQHFVYVCSLTSEIFQALFMGVIASQLKHDIDNSASNVNKSYERNPEHRSTLERLVQHELSTLGREAVRADRTSGTVGLLWAKRSIHFVVMYLDLLSTRPDLDASACAQQTYDAVLAPYHGWLTGKFVGTVMGFAPAREDVYSKLGLVGRDDLAREFVQIATRVLDEIQAVFAKFDADFPDKV